MEQHEIKDDNREVISITYFSRTFQCNPVECLGKKCPFILFGSLEFNNRSRIGIERKYKK